MHRSFYGWRPLQIVLFIVIAMMGLAGCGSSPGKQTTAQSKKIFDEGKMVHMKQVVESYDDQGNPLPRYYELWLAKDRAARVELDASGHDQRVEIDAKGQHIGYDPVSRLAQKYEFSPIQKIDFPMMDKAINMKRTGERNYAARNCEIYLGGEGSDDWVQLYVDKETGYVLYCDAPLLRIRTASVDIKPLEEEVFTVPTDLIFK